LESVELGGRADLDLELPSLRSLNTTGRNGVLELVGVGLVDGHARGEAGKAFGKPFL
jgi:hypothetical protein